MKTWAAKDPNEVVDRFVNWSARLDEGETILTSDFILVEGTVEIESEALATPVATIWLSGGVAGETCTFTNRVTTSGGRTYDQSVRIRIKDK